MMESRLLREWLPTAQKRNCNPTATRRIQGRERQIEMTKYPQS